MFTKKLYPVKPGAVVIEGHVQGLSNTRSLGELGVPVIVVDKNDCIARYSKYCWKFYRCPEYYQNSFAEFLISLAQKEDIKNWVLFPSNDHAVYKISKNKCRLEQYYNVITPELNIIRNIYDKAKLLELARKCIVPIPETKCFHSKDEMNNENIFFPVITKGRFGLSFYRAIGRKALLSHNRKELMAHLNYINKKYNVKYSITQELIPFNGSNNILSFAAFCVDGKIKTYWMGEKLREHPLRFGTATFAKSVYVEECYKLSIHLIKALNYTGVCEVEYMRDPRDGEYKLIEINPRTWLWVGLAKACGVDFAKIVYEYINGKKIVYSKNYETGVYWINPLSDTAYAFKGFLSGKLSLLEYLRSISNKKMVNALFNQDDWKPGFSYLFNITKYLKNR